MSALTPTKQGFWPRFLSLFRAKRLPTTELEAEDDFKPGVSFAEGVQVAPAYDPDKALSAYGAFPWVRACVNAIAEDATRLPRQVVVGYGKDAEVYDNHPVLALLARPNSRDNGVVFNRQRVVDFLLAGNSMRAVSGVESGEPASLHRLHPDLYRIEPDAMGHPLTFQGESALASFPAEHVLHDRMCSWEPGPRSLWGESPIRALDRDLTTDMEAAKRSAKMAAAGQPQVLIAPDSKDPSAPRVRMSKEDKREHRLGMERALNRSGAGIVIADIGLQVTKLGFSPRDMEFGAARQWVREAVLAEFAVPPTKVGLPMANYATAKQQQVVYWERIKAHCALFDAEDSRLARMFTRWAQANLGSGWQQKIKTLRVETLFDDVEALQESADARVNRVHMHILAGVAPAFAYECEGFPKIAEHLRTAAPYPGTEEPEPAPEEEAEEQRSLMEVNGHRGIVLPMFGHKSAPTLELFKDDEEPEYDYEEASLTEKAPARYDHIDFSPPQGVQDECQKGLDWHEEGESGDGLRPATVTWARRLASGGDITPDKARKMRAWLARHESDKEGEGFSPGEDGFPSPGRVAWALWGGDPAVGWSNKLVEQMDAADREAKRSAQWAAYIERAHAPTERAMALRLRQALQKQAETLAARIPDLLAQVDRQHSKQISEDQIAEVLRIAESMGIVREAALEDIRKALELGFNEAVQALSLTGATEGAALERALEAQLGTMITNTTPATKKAAADVVRRSLEEGWTVNQTQAALMQSPGFGASRALNIARTETTTALETGADAGYDEAVAAGVDFQLEWLTSRDPAVRDSHRAMDGQKRKRGGEYVSGAGHRTTRPGGFGIASEDVNCRCVRVPVLDD